MIDPVIFEFNLLGLPIILRWYGVLVMLGAVSGALIAEREIKRRGENGESVWDALVWILPAGIVGARLWYVLNSILGGSNYYTSQPAKILYIWEGGLHFFGGLLLGAIALYYYLKQNGMDFWLFLDAIAPAALIGQALARPANFINQELYGQPTKLMWGIPIDASHRLPQFSDLTQFPVETTRFHPTFAYEMILNILLALLLLWISRRYAEKMKPGAIFAGWLISAGLIRAFIEFFRPDQPRIGDSIVTYSMFVSILMAISGIVLLLIRYGKLQLAAADGWEEQYQIKPVEKKARTRSEKSNVEDEAFVNDLDGEVVAEPETKVRVAKSKTPEKKPSKKKVSEEKKAPAKRSKTVK